MPTHILLAYIHILLRDVSDHPPSKLLGLIEPR